MFEQSSDTCPRCGEARLRSWFELGEEERIIASRLPSAADYSASERETMHRWCTRCWYEEMGGVSHDV